jgi:phage baseplate assembly protein V
MDYDTDNVFPRDKTGRDSELRTMIRTGKVVEQCDDPTGIFVRVQWLDKDMLISQPLPVMFPAASGTRKASFPKIGADVDVMMLPNGDEDGYVIGCHYSTSNPPPITPDSTRAAGEWFNLDHTQYPSGTIIEYDENTDTYKIDSVGPVNIRTTSNITINGVDITITASGAITIKGATITLDGPTTIEGDLTVNGNISNVGDMSTTGVHIDSLGPHTA